MSYREWIVSTKKGGKKVQTVVDVGRRDRVNLRLPAGMNERIKALAEEDARTVTSWIEKAIRDAIERSEREKKH